MSYFEKAKKIVDDIFFDKKAYLADTFLNINSYEDFKNISQKSLSGILYDKSIDINKFTSGDYILINKHIFNLYKEIAKTLLIDNYYDEKFSTGFLYLLYFLNFNALNMATVIKNKSESLIFLPTSSFDFALHEKLYFDIISPKKEIIDNFFKDLLENENVKYEIEDSFLNSLEKTYENYVSEEGLIYLKEQIESVKNTLNYKLSNIKGVAGSAKTFTGMLSLISCCCHFKKKEKNPYKVLVTGHTYKSVEEALRKLSEITKNNAIKTFLNENNISKIKAFFLTSLSKKESTKNLENLSNDVLDVYVDNEFKGFDNENYDAYFLFLPLPIITSAITDIDIATNQYHFSYVKNILAATIKGKKVSNLIQSIANSAFSRLDNLKLPYEINEDFNHIHIEEASQFSAVNLSAIASLIKPEKILRFSFSGDPKQLSSIYNYKMTKINLLRIGAFYNLFTLFEDTNIKTSYLNYSLRNPKYITDIIKDIYPEFDLKVLNSNLDTLYLKYSTEFEKAISEALPVFRISYDIISKKPFKNKLTTENMFETFIAKKILNFIENLISKDYFILTLFKKQEIDLLKNNIKNCGTVDKMQGKEAYLTGILTSSYDMEYASKIIPFIAVPNRINVAFTRTKRFFFMVSSKNLEYSLYNYYSGFKEIDEFELGYKITKNKTIDEKKVKNLLVNFDINLGIYILQKFINQTSEKVGEFYIPLSLNNEFLEILESAEIENKIPKSENYIILDIFKLKGS